MRSVLEHTLLAELDVLAEELAINCRVMRQESSVSEHPLALVSTVGTVAEYIDSVGRHGWSSEEKSEGGHRHGILDLLIVSR